jgi:hypothetical protein
MSSIITVAKPRVWINATSAGKPKARESAEARELEAPAFTLAARVHSEGFLHTLAKSGLDRQQKYCYNIQ